eukprot:5637929-Alexandrium_andersonii.AAC.1
MTAGAAARVASMCSPWGCRMVASSLLLPSLIPTSCAHAWPLTSLDAHSLESTHHRCVTWAWEETAEPCS